LVAADPNQSASEAFFVSRRGQKLLKHGISWLRAVERLDVEVHVANMHGSLSSGPEAPAHLPPAVGKLEHQHRVDVLDVTWSPQDGWEPLRSSRFRPRNSAELRSFWSWAFS
jgi:hypothetical protein